ncbi:High-affinity iron permease, putative [Yarrowia lipolytica]|jgi:high-affinity iron transporter|nr:High-affinity iron permease, putative [Yarrowia lipolytica]
MTADVFSVEVFFICFRECLEAAIVISVLLSFVKQGLGGGEDKTLYKKLLKQIWIGAAGGIVICLCIGGGFIGAYYSFEDDIWSKSEDLWEGIFSVIATILITVMGLAMLRINKMKEKWRMKIAKALLEDHQQVKGFKKFLNFRFYSKKYAMAILPFITTLREGVEAIVFIGGVAVGRPATAFPLAVFCGLLAGCACGYLIYRGGNMMSIQIFLIASTCFLYLIAAGLISRAVWYFQMYRFSLKTGGDVAEQGSGPGSYNVHEVVWHVNCCNPETDNGWEIFNALFGWQNSPTYGSVIIYNLYWLCIIGAIFAMLFQEKHGYYPGFKWAKRFQKKEYSKEEIDEMFHRAAATQINEAAQYHAGSSSEDLDKGVNDVESKGVDDISPGSSNPEVSRVQIEMSDKSQEK